MAYMMDAEIESRSASCNAMRGLGEGDDSR